LKIESEPLEPHQNECGSADLGGGGSALLRAKTSTYQLNGPVLKYYKIRHTAILLYPEIFGPQKLSVAENEVLHCRQVDDDKKVQRAQNIENIALYYFLEFVEKVWTCLNQSAPD
jgi:hypothetical protein